MKLLGISALVLTILSAVFWLSNWVFSVFIVPGFEMGYKARYVGQALSIVSAVAEFTAMGLISIAMIIAAKKLTKPAGETPV